MEKIITIDNKNVCKYVLEQNHLYIRCFNPILTEELLIKFISIIEEVEIRTASYLNVEL